MKPCSSKKKLITWLALDALDAPAAQDLRAHLETCPGCRAYLAEISGVTRQVAAAAPEADLPASERFHREVMARIRAEAPPASGRTVLVSLRAVLLHWRIAVPAAVAVAVLVVLGMVNGTRTEIQPQPPAVVTIPNPVAPAVGDPPPTVACYQEAAGQSLEKLDALLLREGDRSGGPARVCTASTMSLNF